MAEEVAELHRGLLADASQPVRTGVDDERRSTAGEFSGAEPKGLLSTTASAIRLTNGNSDYLALHSADAIVELDPCIRNSTFFQSLVNGVNTLAGIGILSTPYATAESGWLGLSLLLLFAAICCYTGHLLQRCMATAPGLNTYPDIGEAAFGKVGRWITALLLYAELYAVAVDLLILESDNLTHLFPSASATVWGVHLSANRLFLLISAAAVLPTVLLRDLSLLANISTVGVLSTLTVVLGVAWIGVFDGVGFTNQGQLLVPSGLPAAAGLFGFCFSGHAVIPNLYASMKEPSRFPQVMILSFLTCFLMYGGIAICGYLMYGDSVKEQITLNLPSQLPSTNVVIWTTVLTPLTKYALTISPLAYSIEDSLGLRGLNLSSQGLALAYALRTMLVLSAVIVAATLPFFAFLVAFTGSSLSLTMSVIFPCIFAWKLIPGSRLANPALLVAVLSLGIVSAIAGTYYSVKGIIGKLGDDMGHMRLH